MRTIRSRAELPAKTRPAVTSKKRWIIFKGGRGSAKSWTIANILLDRMLADGKPRICTRHIQKSIFDSVHALMAKQIKLRKLDQYFDVQATTIKCYNGGRFLFRGMNDLQSLEGHQDAFIEEGQNAKEQEMNELIPTIREDGSQIFVAYNPKNDSDFIHRIATDDAYKDMRTVIEMNWRDNPWFPDVLDKERKLMKRINIDLYNHIWEGETLKQIEGAIIKAEYFQRYTELPSIKKAIIVADTAAEAKEQNDYTVYMFGGVDIHGNIYIMDLYRGKIESMERIQKAKDFWNKHRWRQGYGVGARIFMVEKAVSGFDLIQQLRSHAKVAGITRTKQKSGFPGKFGRLMDQLPIIAEGKVYLPDNPITYNGIQVSDAAWVDDFVSENQSFTADDSHDNDDQVDCLIDLVKQLSSKNDSLLSAMLRS